jgi:type III secretion protein L
MAKIIKQNKQVTDPHILPRAPIIRRDTTAARIDAEHIRQKAQIDANEIVSKAQIEAEQAIAKIKTEAEEMREGAKKEGYEAGRQEGVEKLMEATAQVIQRMNDLEAQLIPQIKDLSLAIVRKILGKELELHPEEVVSIIRQALSDKARQRKEIVLRVNPADLDIVRQSRGQLVEVLSRCKEIALREDPNVELHGVVIETDAGVIDAQLETQLQVFERVLKNIS